MNANESDGARDTTATATAPAASVLQLESKLKLELELEVEVEKLCRTGDLVGDAKPGRVIRYWGARRMDAFV